MQYTNHIPIINSWYTNYIASGKLRYKQLLKIALIVDLPIIYFKKKKHHYVGLPEDN